MNQMVPFFFWTRVKMALFRHWINSRKRSSEEALLKRVRQYNAQKRNRNAKVVCYTAIFGSYDSLIQPEHIVDEWDYVCFTDEDVPGEHVYEIRRFEPGYDFTRRARYIKTHPHEFFPNYEYSVWLDSNFMIRGPFLENSVQDRINRNVLITGCPHPQRTCLYEELESCIMRAKDDVTTMSKQVEQYRKEGMPRNYGLIETNILIRKHNDTDMIAFNEAWWREIHLNSRRDQLSIMYIIWKKGMEYEYLDLPSDPRYDKGQDSLLYQHIGVKDKTRSEYSQPEFVTRPLNSPLFKNIPFLPEQLDPFRNRRVDIIVCVHNALEDVTRCLDSVLSTREPLHHLIIVDDGSEKETKDYLVLIAGEHTDGITLIRHEKAKGYTRSANVGLRASEAPFMILLNSDTIVSKNWALKMAQVAESSPEIGFVGPLSNAASWQSVPKLFDPKKNNNPLPANKLPADLDSLCERIGYFPTFPRAFLINGFCYGIKRTLIEKIGYLDEKAFPVGYGEEDDFSLRASSVGFSGAIATHCYVWHAKSKSFGTKERSRLVKMGQDKLKAH
ncbi:MAG: glycosyltransferase, partial [Planctomycetota bacterium]|nr:glycosyltransferase [Planctomycetota bacterium]